MIPDPAEVQERTNEWHHSFTVAVDALKRMIDDDAGRRLLETMEGAHRDVLNMLNAAVEGWGAERAAHTRLRTVTDEMVAVFSGVAGELRKAFPDAFDKETEPYEGDPT